MKRWVIIAYAGLGLIGLGGCATTSGYAGADRVRPVSIAAAPVKLAAIPEAERAVAAKPTAADRRVALGRLYLAAGRFGSAESAFGDALTLDPSLGGAFVSRALAQLAQGHDADARATLEQARGKAPEADMGLGLALAGEQAEAIALLESTIRRSGGDVRVRQNLALAYGLAGRWADAANMAAHDVPADQLGDRLRRWALIVQQGPGAAGQIRAILGVSPAIDPGQPAMLALTLPKVTGPAVPIVAASASLAPARPVIVPPRAERKAAPLGRFVVQLGAYRSSGRLETAWTRLSVRTAYLSTYAPAASRLQSRGDSAVLHRLAIGGFDTRAAAARICSRIVADGGHCFVRAAAGDRPMTWASGTISANRQG